MAAKTIYDETNGDNPRRKPSSGCYRHAAVIGGSLAGLLAARVLAEYFDTVTVVERDEFPAVPAPRKGVPQARHQHVLLARGRLILEHYFPGLQAELVQAGAPLLDMAQDLAWLTPAGWGARFSSDLLMFGCSRDLLEWTIRQRVSSTPGVRFLQGCETTGLVLNASGSAVTGIRLKSHGCRGDRSSGEQILQADLVVDASG